MNETELAERLRRTRPTLTPSPELELKVARLAAAKASEETRHPHSTHTLGQKVAFGLTGTFALLGLGVAVAFGPRLVHAYALDRAAVNLEMSPFVHTTLYTVAPDGKEQRVGEGFFHGDQGRVTYGEDTWTWEKQKFLSHFCEGGRERERQESRVSGPEFSLYSFARFGKMIFTGESATLFRLPDRRIVSQAAFGDERTVVRLDSQGSATELETQVWDRGTWHPAARTRIDTQPYSLSLLKSPTVEKPIRDRDKEEKLVSTSSLATIKLGKETITVRRLLITPRGDVFLELQHPQPQHGEPYLKMHLTDSAGRHYAASDSTPARVRPEWCLQIWFFPTQQGGQLPKEVTLTLSEAKLTMAPTPTTQSLPPRTGVVDLFRERGTHEEIRLSALLRDAWEHQAFTRLLELTDQWLALQERERPLRTHSRLTNEEFEEFFRPIVLRVSNAELWLYRTAALRSLGRLDEARNALEHAKRTWPTGQETVSITQEEALLLAK